MQHRKLEDVNLEEAMKNMSFHTVTKLSIPKFNLEQEEDLMEECVRLGLASMFSPSSDFDHMFKDSILPKFIKKIKQKTYINVDENGTEAASVKHTVMCLETCMMPNSLKEVEFIADHPFSFFILGPKDVVLFSGKFYNY